MSQKSKIKEMRRKPILFFDSGIGGLTVLREARLLLPEYPFLYVVDNAAFPYGAWQENALRTHLLELFSSLLAKYDPVLCVLACNTASTLVLDDLRKCFPKCQFVGTVPAIKPASERSASKQISVLATMGTVKRTYTQELVQKYAGNSAITLVGSRNLATIAEDYIHDRPIDLEMIRKEIKPCFIKEGGKFTDIVVLACTHYPFLTALFRSVAPWPVDWLDPAEAIARRAQFLLNDNKQDLHDFRSQYKSIDNYQDYVVFTEKKVMTNFITQRLFHAFGLRFAV